MNQPGRRGPTGYTGLGFDPVPGDPRRVAALADAATTAGRHAADAHGVLAGAVTTSQPWHGAAADEFRRRGGELPGPLATQRDSTSAAAQVLYEWATTLSDLRLRAEQLDRPARNVRSRLADAEEQVEQWTTAVSVASTHTRAAATATLAGHEQERDTLHAELASIVARARALAAEHAAAAAGVTARLRALAPTAPPTATGTPPATQGSLGALLTGLSDATRRASAVAGLAAAAPMPPPAGAVAIASAPPALPARGTWVFGSAVPVAALPGGRRRDTAT